MTVGERVSVRDGGVGVLVSKDASGVVVEMADTADHLHWSSSGSAGARLRRKGPDLVYVRDHSRSNTNQSAKIRAVRKHIWAWHETHNFPSPNTRDTIRKRKACRQFEEKIKIYRMNTWDELWGEYKGDPANQDMVDHIQEAKIYIRAPPIFITSAPWYLIKGKNEACLCLRCEQMSCKQRPRLDVSRTMQQIMKGMSVCSFVLSPPPTTTKFVLH